MATRQSVEGAAESQLKGRESVCEREGSERGERAVAEKLDENNLDRPQEWCCCCFAPRPRPLDRSPVRPSSPRVKDSQFYRIRTKKRRAKAVPSSARLSVAGARFRTPPPRADLQDTPDTTGVIDRDV